MTRNVKYVCATHGEFWSSYRSATPKSKGTAPAEATCPTCRLACPRVHQPKPPANNADDAPRLRIAVDVQFSPGDAALFAAKGIDIVVWAQPGEMDECWLARAKRERVDLICSPDVDAQIYAYDNRIFFIRTRRQRSRADRLNAVMGAWTRLRATGALP